MLQISSVCSSSPLSIFNLHLLWHLHYFAYNLLVLEYNLAIVRIQV